MSNVSTSKKLAKNTMLMYFRMIILMLITLYTSRIVLQQLGVEDFGIYNLVGSVVAMFTSLKSIFSASTQRFLNYEMGKGAYSSLSTIFNTSLRVNIAIAITFVIIVEIVGIWFLNYKINVDADRLFAAKCVFQFSVLTAALSIVNTTLDAEIIAHEKMDFYAYVSIIEGVFKLLIAFALAYTCFDKLIIYSFLHLVVIVVLFIVNYIYCRHNFSECRLSRLEDRSYLKKMTQFAGWNFLGTNAYILTQNGLNMVLNVFGGPIINAARGIAYQVNAAVNSFISNVVVVINPYCVKTYAEGNLKKAMDSIILSSKILFAIQLCIMTPLIYFTKDILEIWLGTVPEYSVPFIRLIMVYSLVRSLHPTLDIWFKAVGKLKQYQIFEGLLLVLPLVTSYIALRINFDYVWVFIFMIVFDIINLFGILEIARKISSFSIPSYLMRVIIPCIIISILPLIGFIYLQISNNTFVKGIILSILADILCLVFLYLFGFNKSEKNIFKNLTKIMNK